MHSSTANNTYRFASHGEIRAKARRAAGQELFAEWGLEGIQSPPQCSLTCAQVCAGAGPRVLCTNASRRSSCLWEGEQRRQILHTVFLFFSLTVTAVNELALAVFVSLAFAAWDNVRVHFFPGMTALGKSASNPYMIVFMETTTLIHMH